MEMKNFPMHRTNLRRPGSGRATLLVLVLAIVLAALALPAAGQAAHARADRSRPLASPT